MNKYTLITINVPVIYMARDEMILMGTSPFRGPLKGGGRGGGEYGVIVGEWALDRKTPVPPSTFTGTEYIFYCKRAILFLSSSKILTPIPLSARRVCTFVAGGGQTRRAERGMGGVNILEDERNRIALLQ